MDQFGEQIESLYLDDRHSGTAEDTGASRSVSSSRLHEHRRQPTSFLDLPGELRNAIYSPALARYRPHVRIGFKYDAEFPPLPPRGAHLQQWKPPYRGIYYGMLLRSEVGTVYRTEIREQWPPLAHVSPLLKRQVLDVHYSENVFRLALRNFLDRRLCAQWIAERGVLLEGVREVKLQMPYMLRRWQWSLVIVVTRLDDGSVAVRTLHNHYRGVGECTCSFGEWVDMMLAVQGRHPDYSTVPEAGDVGSVMEAVIKICEAAEWAEAIWEVLNPPGSKHRHACDQR
ncbi:hypothetical protein B0A55_09636, partial [Friedmanniomyces simplex]